MRNRFIRIPELTKGPLLESLEKKHKIKKRYLTLSLEALDEKRNSDHKKGKRT